MLLGAITLTIIGGVWLFARPAATPDGPRPTAVVWTTTPTPIPMELPTPTPAPVTPGMEIGVRVQVIGTGGAGLNIRSEPGTEAERVAVATEGEALLVVGGPRDADGYVWWFVRDEVTPEREGWAAQDFLALVD